MRLEAMQMWDPRAMRHREFWQCVDAIFGVGHGRTLTASHVLPELANRTAEQALADGEDPGRVWVALCREFDMPEQLHWGLPQRK